MKVLKEETEKLQKEKDTMNDDGPDNVDGEEGGGATAMDTTATATSTWNLAREATSKMVVLQSVLEDIETHATKQTEEFQQLRRRADDADSRQLLNALVTAIAVYRDRLASAATNDDVDDAIAENNTAELFNLQNEIETMNNSIVDSAATSNDDDIIEINAGGKIISALRSTLTLAPDTMFSSKFSGRWEERMKRDNNGRVFIDEDSELIEIIINFLRKKKREDPSNPVQSPPKVREEKKEDFISLLDYYGLSDFFYPPPVLLPLDIANIEVFQPYGSVVDVTKSVDKIQFNKASRETGHWFVACKPSLDVSKEGSFWKVTIDVLPNNHRISLGIIGNIGASNFSFSDSPIYGWGCNGVVYGGSDRSEDSGWTGFTEGECLYFHLKSNKLTMFSFDKNRKFVIGGIAATAIREYYIHFNFQTHQAGRTAHIFGAKISLEPLSDEERKLLLEN